MSATSPQNFEVVVIGTGFSGLGAAIRLKQEGIDDFVVLEKAGERRRHLARQHLSRVRLRRAVAPVLVLVRAQPEVVADVRAAAGDPRLPRALHRQVRRAPAHPVRRRGHRGGVRRGGRAVARRGQRRRGGLHRPRRRRRLRPAEPPRVPRDRRHRATSRARPSTRPSGTTTTTCAASASPSSAPAPARSSSSRRSRRDVERLHLFQRTPPWIMPKPDRPIDRASSAGCSGASRRSSRLYRESIYWRLEAPRPRLHAAPAGDEGRRARRPGAHPPPGQGPRAAPRGHAGLHDRLQAHPDLQRLLPGAQPRQRRRRHRRHRADHASTASSPPTGPSTRSTRSSTAPASRCTTRCGR